MSYPFNTFIYRIDFINNHYKKLSTSEIIIPQGFHISDLEDFKQDIDTNNIYIENLYGFDFTKDKIGTGFIFIKINNKYYIHNISGFRSDLFNDDLVKPDK